MGRVNPAAANVLGTMGAVFWSIQVIPQIVKSHRSKSTAGLSAWLMLCWAAAGLPLGTYNIAQGFNIPLIIQPQMFAALCGVSWAQCLHYSHNLTGMQAVGAWFAFCTIVGSLEVGFVYACRAGKQHGTDAPTTLFGVLSAVLILGGLIPQYYEIFKFKAVVGISLLFLFVDLMGGLVSCLSLIFQEEFDILASVTYGGLVVLELGVFILAGILNPRMERRKREELERTVEDNDMRATPAAIPGSRETTV
ncbi:hypothetical protein EXIGLDRAFT_717329 [Exidia glandulosa HHB12029]|uniref:PQ-loop-domain-containing protein n=1 Tax=Exidia glandulosa HHB12029 TaxID=1314781 RepID=A0A165IFY0_EXIGL|nr:hypothetical protein EXIGLDRAFT_717329 [Exidia glandulosa HHB12029]